MGFQLPTSTSQPDFWTIKSMDGILEGRLLVFLFSASLGCGNHRGEAVWPCYHAWLPGVSSGWGIIHLTGSGVLTQKVVEKKHRNLGGGFKHFLFSSL